MVGERVEALDEGFGQSWTAIGGLGESLRHGLSAIAYRVDRRLEGFSRDAEFLSPISNLVLLLHRDARAVLWAAVCGVVAHRGFLSSSPSSANEDAVERFQSRRGQ